MRILPPQLAMLFGLPLGALMASASLADEIPNLVGEWHGTYTTLVYHDGGTRSGNASMVLTISRQEGELIFASSTWDLHEDNPAEPDIAGDIVRGGVEELIGVVEHDDDDFTLLETEDNGIYDLELEGANLIEGIYYEQGNHEATIFRVRLTRQ